jgi:hypothetical protein
MEALTDFLSQMHLAAVEESPLYEIPRGSIDLMRDTPVVHGPWPASTCAAVLRIWYGQGWIALYYPEPPPGWNITPADWCAHLVDGDVLPQAVADTLLDHPERWIADHADGQACLYQSDLGEATPWRQWYEAVVATAQRLPLADPKN